MYIFLPAETSSSMDESKLGYNKESMLVHMLLKDELLEPDMMDTMQPPGGHATHVVLYVIFFL